MKETPSQLPIPAFVMNFPFTLDTAVPNNVWMQEMEKEELKINKGNAYRQFLDLYQFAAGNSLVCNLPATGNYQDLVYVANMGIYLPHIKDSNNIILSNFTSEPRQGEEKVGKPFFESMGYEAHSIMLPNRTELAIPLRVSSILMSITLVCCDNSSNSSSVYSSVQINVFSCVNGKIEQSRW